MPVSDLSLCLPEVDASQRLTSQCRCGFMKCVVRLLGLRDLSLLASLQCATSTVLFFPEYALWLSSI